MKKTFIQLTAIAYFLAKNYVDSYIKRMVRRRLLPLAISIGFLFILSLIFCVSLSGVFFYFIYSATQSLMMSFIFSLIFVSILWIINFALANKYLKRFVTMPLDLFFR